VFDLTIYLYMLRLNNHHHSAPKVWHSTQEEKQTSFMFCR